MTFWKWLCHTGMSYVFILVMVVWCNILAYWRGPDVLPATLGTFAVIIWEMFLRYKRDKRGAERKKKVDEARQARREEMDRVIDLLIRGGCDGC